jgi:drug/metabolite transporter (DMT)-like permease
MKPRLSILATAILAVLATAIGVAAVVLGESDDSPGLQLLGVLFVLGAVALGVRTARRTKTGS